MSEKNKIYSGIEQLCREMDQLTMFYSNLSLRVSNLEDVVYHVFRSMNRMNLEGRRGYSSRKGWAVCFDARMEWIYNDLSGDDRATQRIRICFGGIFNKEIYSEWCCSIGIHCCFWRIDPLQTDAGIEMDDHRTKERESRERS